MTEWDSLRKSFGKRLASIVRETDTVSFTSGDEFALLLTEVTETEYTANVAQKILENVSKPFMLDSYEVKISASIGISIYPDDSEDIEKLFNYPDTAKFQAKEDGRNNYLHNDPSMSN